MQTRGVATRQKIIDSAVDLFAERGYLHTGLTDITGHAQITTGAFYHHFESKEAVAVAINAQGWPKASGVLDSCLNANTPGLENVIVMTFALSDLILRDKSVRVINQLNQATGQFNDDRRRGFQQQINTFIDAVAGAIPPSVIQDHITPRAVGEMLWMAVHGCQLPNDALADDVFRRLTANWQMLLRSLVPAASLPYYERFLARTAGGFDPALVTVISPASEIRSVSTTGNPAAPAAWVGRRCRTNDGNRSSMPSLSLSPPRAWST